jgi:hypothetical protein
MHLYATSVSEGRGDPLEVRLRGVRAVTQSGIAGACVAAPWFIVQGNGRAPDRLRTLWTCPNHGLLFPNPVMEELPTILP